MSDSILDSIKLTIPISPDDDTFDSSLIMYTNTCMLILSQLGLSEADGYVVTSRSDKWSDLIGSRKDLEFIKTYVTMRVRSMFDPPQSSVAVESIDRIVKEIEWRICNISAARKENV